MPHSCAVLSPHLSSCSTNVHVEVWSGRKGWGLVVGEYDPLAGPYINSYVREGSTLAPGEDVPHPPRPGEGITLSVLTQRQGTLILHRVSHCSLMSHGLSGTHGWVCYHITA